MNSYMGVCFSSIRCLVRSYVLHPFNVLFDRKSFECRGACFWTFQNYPTRTCVCVSVSVCFPLQFLEFSMTTFYKKRRGLQLKVQLLRLRAVFFFQYFGGSDGSCPDWLAADRDPRANTRN